MADFFSPYVSFRQQAGGGGVARIPRLQPASALTRSTSVVLLIHGYNSDQRAASESFTGWVGRQVEIGRLDANVVGVYWPGDNWERALFYMQAIPLAVDTALSLAQSLRDAANTLGSLRLRIVAHSLGSRVTMELLARLTNPPQANLLVERFVVMAAAVATWRLDPTKPFRIALDQTPANLMSLYSPDDRVLAFAFPVGESLAGGGFFPAALGHKKWTASNAIPLPRLEQWLIAGAGHGDYWSGVESKPKTVERARLAARKARSFLNLGPLPRVIDTQEISARETADARVISPRGTEQARVIPSRQTT